MDGRIEGIRMDARIQRAERMPEDQLARRMKELRAERGISQTKLAALADLNPGTVNKVEQGKREASEKTMRRLARAFGVGLAELLGEES